MDRMTKLAHFLPMKTTDPVEKLTRLHLKEIVQLHSVPVSIVLDRDYKRDLIRGWNLIPPRIPRLMDKVNK